MNSIEQREGSDIVVSFDDGLSTVKLRAAQLSSGPEKDGFKFDRVFPMGTMQQEVFDYGVKGYYFCISSVMGAFVTDGTLS